MQQEDLHNLNPIKNHIGELKRDLRIVKAALTLLEDDDSTAILVRIALGNDQFLDYWVDENTNVVHLLMAEKNILENELKELDA